jgi:tetratricopeptide (TPR) repeat protein
LLKWTEIEKRILDRSMRGHRDIRNLLAAFVLSMMFTQAAFATGAEPVKDLRVDPALCLAAALASDHDKTVNLCSALIDNGKTEKADRIKALIARATAYERKDMVDRAISDYDGALRLDSAQADVHNARGELLRKKGDLPKAVADFAAAIKLDPEHAVARANHRALAQEAERQGALKAVAGKPSFDCATARRKVEKAICANPELADLDREVQGSYQRAAAEKMTPQQARKLRREQEDYIARRNAEYGRPGYDLKKAMLGRLQKINGIDGY